MQFMTVKEAATRWGLTERRVQELCRDGLIVGVTRWQRSWMIPQNADRPADRRRQSYRVDGEKLPTRKSPFLSMTNYFRTPGSGDDLVRVLSDQPATARLFEAQLLYFRGAIDRACELARSIVTTPSGFETRVGAGILLALCAIVKGDLAMWQEGKKLFITTPCRTDPEREELMFWRAAVRSEVLDVEGFPEWLACGRFFEVPIDVWPMARVVYLKYLYVKVHNQSVSMADQDHMSQMMRMVSAAGEPMVCQSSIMGALLPEIYLRLLCGVAYHRAGQDEEAAYHLDAAIRLALPDQLLFPFVEYRKDLDYLLDNRLEKVDPVALRRVKTMSKQYAEGWTAIHNAVLFRTVSNELTVRERETARLAVYGLSNKEIALRLHISLNAVKQALKLAMDKTGASKRDELAAFI